MKNILLFLSASILFVLVTSDLSVAKNGYHDIEASGVKAMMDKDEALVIFPLSPMEYDHKHIKGSINIIPAMMEYELPVDKKKPLIFYCLGVKCAALWRALLSWR
jgi:rhodanese-related sulfurtransferase